MNGGLGGAFSLHSGGAGDTGNLPRRICIGVREIPKQEKEKHAEEIRRSRIPGDFDRRTGCCTATRSRGLELRARGQIHPRHIQRQIGNDAGWAPVGRDQVGQDGATCCHGSSRPHDPSQGPLRLALAAPLAPAGRMAGSVDLARAVDVAPPSGVVGLAPPLGLAVVGRVASSQGLAPSPLGLVASSSSPLTRFARERWCRHH